MNLGRIVLVGVIAGLLMGVFLFVTGAVASRVVYGPEMAPEGKFDAEQLNPLYFIWTKLLIGVVFGVFIALLYERLPLSNRIDGPVMGLKYSFWLWLVIYLWNRSHPWVYESPELPNQLFWLIYTLGGFLGFGLAFGYVYNRLYTTAA
jgi:hypothetical protein